MRHMRFAPAILLLGLACCREKQTDAKEVLTCMSSQTSRDDYSLATRCEPLGKSERFAGTWFVGFETSMFKEEGASRIDRSTDYHRLIVPTPLDDATHKVDSSGYAAYDVVFVGRRSLLQTSEPSTFVA